MPTKEELKISHRSLRLIVKDTTGNNVSGDSVEYLRRYLQSFTEDIARSAFFIAKSHGRTTIQLSDILIARNIVLERYYNEVKIG